MAVDSAAPLPTGVVTFLLTDIVGSTTWWERHPAAMASALERHDRIVGDVVGARGGVLLKSRGEGDSTFSVFARATDAVVAAVDLQRALRDEDWPAPLDLWVRAAVHTGEAIERDGDYFGPTVNRAARLRGLATGGQVVLSRAATELVHRHLPPSVEVDDLGPLPIAGSDHPEHVRALRIEGLGPGPSARSRGAPPPEPLALPPFLAAADRTFVGREPELEVLLAAWQRVEAGATEVVTVAGEPGIGKSSLVAAIARRIHARGGTVLAGRCDEGYEVPYQPFIEALDPLVGHPLGITASSLHAPLGGELARILPRAAALAPAPPGATDPQTARYRLFEAVATWLAAVSSTAPVALVVEDLHWATAPTALMLHHVARFPIERLLVLVTYRPPGTGGRGTTGEAIAGPLADLRATTEVTDLELAGLRVEDVGALLSQVATPGSADPAGAGTIHARTGGNPLFVRELLAGEGTAAGDGTAGRLSARTQEVVLRRVRSPRPPANGSSASPRSSAPSSPPTRSGTSSRSL
jgi:class 3 adenylate cyclase